MLSNVYGPHDQNDRRTFFVQLNLLCRNYQGPWVLMGDFNAIRFVTDRKERTSNVAASNLFNFVNSSAFLELNLAYRKFTWSNLRENASMAKLGRCFVSLNWHNHYVLYTQAHYISDNFPFMLQPS